MPTKHHINYLTNHRNKIVPPVLIVGSKIYDYDNYTYQGLLKEWGIGPVTGVDLFEGPGVDAQVDITDSGNPFFKGKTNRFNTILCLEVLTNVVNPFLAGQNITSVLADQGVLFLSEPFVRKESAMPVDYWRFTFDAFQIVFPSFTFTRSHLRKFYLRDKTGTLYREKEFVR